MSLSYKRWAPTPDTFAPTHAYAAVILLGSVLLMVNYAMGQLLRAEGAMMPSMLGMFIGTVSNIILDPIFIFACNLGVTGAAIATVLGNGLGICFYCFCYASGKSALQIGRSYLSSNGIIWKEIFTIGTPSGLNQLLVSVALIFMQQCRRQLQRQSGGRHGNFV